MRFSVWPNPQQPWQGVLDVAGHAESTGWDGVWFADHFMPLGDDVSQPTLECWSVLAALAAAVPRVRIGALVSGNTYRHPAVLANIAATVDRISGGRVVLGLGAGWQENEHEAYGIDFYDVRERLARLEEACQVVKALTEQERSDFEGRYYTLKQAPLEPKPVQSPMPLLVGGGGEKVTMRIAATYADEWNVWGTPDVLRHKGEVLDRHCDRLGREPSTIARSAQSLLFLSTDETWLEKQRERVAGSDRAIVGTPAEVTEAIAAYRGAGVDEFIVPDFTLGSGQRKLDTLDLFINEVAPSFT